MSRVLEFSDGAERGDISWWSFNNGVAVQTSGTIHGSYYYLQNGGGAASYKTLTTPLSEFYFRCYMYSVTSASAPTLLFRNGSTALLTLTHDIVNFRWNITGATTGNTGNNSVPGETWQCLEVRYKIDDTVGVVTVRINGIEVFTFSGDTKPGGDSTVNNFYVTGQIRLDDLAIDTATWCGLGYYIAMTADGAGDATEWTPTGAANYQNVGIPANDATYNTGTTGQTDNYAMTSTTLGAASVERVIPFVRASNPAGGTLNVGVLTEGVEHTSAVTTPTSLTWLIGAEYINNPQTGNSWTQAQLDALQMALSVP